MVKNSAKFYLPLTIEGPIGNGKTSSTRMQTAVESDGFGPRTAKYLALPFLTCNVSDIKETCFKFLD